MEHSERKSQTPLSLLRSMGTSMLLALFLLTGASLHAQTTRTSVASGNWSTASTWSPAGVPGSSDNLVIAAGHTVTLTANVSTTGNLTVNGTLSRANRNMTAGSLSGASTGVITSTAGSLTVGSNNSSTTYAGKLSGSSTSTILNKQGTGTLTLSGNSNYTAGGVSVVRGTLRLGVVQALPAAASVVVYNGGTLDLDGNGQQVALLQDGFTISNPASPVAIVTNSSATAATLTIGVVGQANGSSYGSTMSGSLNMVVNDGIELWGSGFGANVNIAVSNGAYLTLGVPSYTTVLSGNLSVATGGIVNLVENATCNTLTLGAATQPNGSYGSTSSSATNQNNTYFMGTGVLNVGQNLVPSTFPGGTSIQARARWGATGYEGGLFIGGTVGPQLNPAGAPVWVIGTAYKFEYGYNGTTGDQTLSIDFNGNNTFDASEVITQSTGFAGQGFQHFSIFMSGDATRSISLNNFVVNGINLGNFVSPTSGSLDLDWVNPAGNFSNITATGTITFTGVGGATSAETGRIWFRTAVPQPLMMAITAPATEYGSAKSMAADARLVMFPNPNNGEQLTMSLSAVEEGVNTISVDIFDLSGARVSSRTIAVNDGMVQQVLSLGEMAEGLYVVSITAGTQRYTERLVIQK